MKGNFLVLLVTVNTTYITFDVVYTKIMLYTQQALSSFIRLKLFIQRHELYIHKHSCLCCVSTTTSSVRTNTCYISTHTVVYPKTHVVSLRTQHVLDV